MKFISISCLNTLVAVAIGRVGSAPEQTHNLANANGIIDNIPPKFLSDDRSPTIDADTPPPESPPPDDPPDWEDEIWQMTYCRGAKLLAAMSASEEKQRNILQWPYIQSKWDGDLHKELEEWGYRDSDELHRNADIFCDFSGSFHELRTAFAAMGIDPKSAEFGGPNHCFHVEHQNGPAVQKRKENEKLPEPKDQRYHVSDKEYRVTGAYSKIGINAKDGIVYFLQRKSPDKAAQDLWQVLEPAHDDLPKLRASSDFAWGFWNRKAVGNLKNIKMIMAMTINNDETHEVIIPRALRALDEDLNGVREWPGTDFDVRNEKHEQAAQALIGSPNGLGAAYFLLQHKVQLGGAKSINKIKIWRTEDEDHEEPNVIFYVEDAAPEEKQVGSREAELGGLRKKDMVEDVASKIVKRSGDGKSVVREHIIRARL